MHEPCAFTLHIQAFKLSSSGTKLRELQAHLTEADVEIERLRDIIAQRGLMRD